MPDRKRQERVILIDHIDRLYSYALSFDSNAIRAEHLVHET
jgi:hypothetical protein